jgi:glycosyltransferase involved in cell wall biosynthesis
MLQESAAEFPLQGLTVSLVVPVYNEEEALPLFFERVTPLAERISAEIERIGRIELVFVDDGSSDRSVDRILDHAPPSLAVKIVKLSRNFRKDNALAAGLAHATGNAVIPIDVDLQDPPDLLPRMIRAWLAGAKVVNAKRASRRGESFVKRTTSGLFYGIFNRLSDYPIDPDVGDYRLFDRQVVDALNAMPERVRFMKGMFSWVGFRPVTLEYERPDRAAGTTKWNYWKLWNFALDGITAGSTVPIRAWTYFGLGVAALSLVFAVFLILRTLLFGIEVPGYASLMVVVLFLGACNLVALGVLGEYVGRLMIEVKQRPVFVVDETIELGERNDGATNHQARAAVASPSDRVDFEAGRR